MIDLLESAALSVFIAAPARARCCREGACFLNRFENVFSFEH